MKPQNTRRMIQILTAATILVAWLGTAGPVRSQADAQPSPRQDIDLDSQWQFLRDEAVGAAAIAYNDSAWQAVNLPHTWNAQDGQDGGDDYYRGPGWYRRHLFLDSALTGKSLFLQFEGASLVTDVYINGLKVGEHQGAFAAFCFDVTNALQPGKDNVIAVRVDNSYTADVTPLSGDFTLFGGLYRDVHLLALNPVSIEPMDNASPGVFLTQQAVSPTSATVIATAEIRNALSKPQTVSVRWHLADSLGHDILTKTQPLLALARSTTNAVQSLSITAPHLWNGVADPYLYHVTVEVLQDNKVVDRSVQPLGLRFFRVDPDLGLLLNGKHYALHGVNRHQDRLDKGWAISPADTAQDFTLVKELGCTGVRLSHYQQAQQFYDLCDQNGLVVWAELPLINYMTLSDTFESNARSQLTELIKQNYNHPAIFFWSLFNELVLSASKTNQTRQLALITRLNTLAHTLDSTRLTTAATYPPIESPLNFITDIVGLNRYYGWYYGSPTDLAKALDSAHRKYPTRCFALSEYGAGASILDHEDHPLVPIPEDAWHPEEWQSTVHEKAWKALQARPYLWGTFLWAMYDFASDSREEGDTAGRNDKGLVTYDRAVKKDAYYFYLANWTQKPFVYITDRRFSPRALTQVAVKIYSNCDTVELTVNGQSLGSKAAADHIFRWPVVKLNAGDNTVLAGGTSPGNTVTDTCVWTVELPAGTPASPPP